MFKHHQPSIYLFMLTLAAGTALRSLMKTGQTIPFSPVMYFICSYFHDSFRRRFFLGSSKHWPCRVELQLQLFVCPRSTQQTSVIHLAMKCVVLLFAWHKCTGFIHFACFRCWERCSCPCVSIQVSRSWMSRSSKSAICTETAPQDPQVIACSRYLLRPRDAYMRRHQTIIWTNTGILLIIHLETNFSEILMEIHTFSLTKTHLTMSCGKWRPFSQPQCVNGHENVKTILHIDQSRLFGQRHWWSHRTCWVRGVVNYRKALPQRLNDSLQLEMT